MFKKVISYLIMPSLLAGYYFTQHTAFLFFIGALGIFSSVFISIALLATYKSLKGNSNSSIKASIGLIKSALVIEKIHLVPKLFSRAVWIVTIGLLAFWNAYVTLSIYLVSVVIMITFEVVLRFLLSVARKFAAEHNKTLDELLAQLEAEVKE